ncbi:hypothetical protein CALVIDRAFT_477574 [Calocera viscosa TUFC12733]|uniref:MULE transposase domain-containing protein n=1 Tax=Calocera viscosa (strain TUFC12733) TaxID=1330018 RepID=A0A167PUS1_CALVF|nr:hypothetical protein CALVIDRAFT_477574 [Calocera viscosa TUFC12733]
MSIWVPLDDTDLHAVVLLGAQPHNHPPFPALKPNAEAKEAAAQCFLAAGGVTAKPSSVDTGPTTLALLGQPLSGKFPAFRDKRKLRDFVQSQRLEEAPLGLEWLGIINAAEEDGRLPANEQYIRATISQPGIHVVVTMNPVLAELIHKCRFLACDFTFKRVHGHFNEWEVASFLDGINENISLARLYSDSNSLEAFRLIWDGFFRAVESTTRHSLQFKVFHKNGNLCAIICDAEAAQAQALGKYFMKINRPTVSGIEEALPERLLLYAFKSCLFHFNQNAHGLSKRGATAEDVNRILSYPSMKDPEERRYFRAWCKEHPLEAIKAWYRNKLGLPWYLPSVNPYESPMERSIWITTPFTSNSSESSHVNSNRNTGTNLPLLSAISW